MADNINITVVESVTEVSQVITQSSVNVAIVASETALNVGIAIDENTLSVAVAVVETPIVVNVVAVQGIEEAPIDGGTYGRKNEGWIAVTVIETDPVFLASVAAGIDAGDIAYWNGNHI